MVAFVSWVGASGSAPGLIQQEQSHGADEMACKF
jgi:hypothetical protein